MRKLFTVASLVGVVMYAWKLWQQNREDAQTWASETDRVR